MTHSEAIDWLYSTQLFGIKLGLDNMRRLADALGVPLGSPPFKTIHVAGTNGKGSTCAIAESVARTAGLRTGLFTSPHLVRFNERIQVDGKPVDDATLTRMIGEARSAAAGWDPHPTFFEIATAIALRHFVDAGVDLVLLETGMGGRLDATNTITPSATAITPVGLDHQQWLGSTLAEIAAEKAGIFKPGIPALTVPQHPAVAEVLESRAAAVGTRLTTVTGEVETSLPGAHQRSNAALAVAALRAAGVCVSDKLTARGLATAAWPGRFQKINDRVTVDGAHNPEAALALSAAWRTIHPNTPATVVFGAVENKDSGAVLNTLAPVASRFIFTAPDSPRATAPETLNPPPDVPSHTEPGLAAALGLALTFPEPVLVTGSLYLVGEAISLLSPASQPFQPSSQ